MERARIVRRVGLVVLGVNLLLVAAKVAVWWQSGSLAVGSEAVNSLTDVGYSAVVLAGLYLTTQPPDSEHPHGHERIEPFVSLFVAGAIVLAGALICWRAVDSLVTGEVAAPTGPWAIGVLAVTAAAKVGLYRYCLRVGEAYNSPAVAATALDNRNDVLTAAAALVGVAGAQAGAPILDPIAAALVALAIVASGLEVARDNVDYLVGGAPSEGLRRDIVERALAHPDVEGVHDVVAHYVGPEIDVSLHVEVEGDHTLLEAHDIETAVADVIREIDEVDDIFVHVDPKELGEWKHEADGLAAPDLESGGERAPDESNAPSSGPEPE